ncbi:MAG: TIGR01777 family oxidoreductase [Caldilineaceae bacterium]|nr:TIGR01777 family oxidoreductase [Caldilineaceae bacterium]
MRIIMTGGTGLIGRALCAALLAENHIVTVLSRDPDKSRDMPTGVVVEEWDAKTTDGWGHLVDGADVVINLAGAGIADAPWTTKRKQLIRESRIDAGLAIRTAIEAATKKPHTLLQASAVGYYGQDHGDEIITEESASGDDYLAKVCFDWEMSTAPVIHLGVRRIILRTGIVLSNQGGAFPKITLPFKFFAGGPLGNGKQWMPWIHITDQIRAIQYLLNHKQLSGPFNLSAPNPVTNKQFSQIVGAQMGRPALLPAPSFAIKTVLGEMSTVLLDGQRAVPQKLEEAGFVFTYPTAQEALSQLLK